MIPGALISVQRRVETAAAEHNAALDERRRLIRDAVLGGASDEELAGLLGVDVSRASTLARGVRRDASWVDA